MLESAIKVTYWKWMKVKLELIDLFWLCVTSNAHCYATHIGCAHYKKADDGIYRDQIITLSTCNKNTTKIYFIIWLSQKKKNHVKE